jgi:regulator of replication initiation timing
LTIELEASVQLLQRRLDRADRKVSIADAATKKITEERDSVVTQLGVAFYNSEELKTDVETLRNENRLLQDQITDLQNENRELTMENEDLRAQLDQARDQHQEDTERWARKEASLSRKATTTDRAILQENQTLRDELNQARVQQEEEHRQAARKEAEVRRKLEKAAQAEHAKLAKENEQLRQELEQAQANREAELKSWATKQAELKARVEHQDETIHHMKAATPQAQINEELRQQNEGLKIQLAKVQAESKAEQQGTPKTELRRRLDKANLQMDEVTNRWTRKESRLRDQLAKAREVNDLTRQIIDVRGDMPRESTQTHQSNARTSTNVQSKRKSTGSINIHDSISEQIEREVSKHRSASAARLPAIQSKSRSRSKSQSRRQPLRSLRHSSAPIGQEDGDSDSSTTDLSFEPVSAQVRPAIPTTTRAPSDDITYLSFIDGDQIAQLRKRLEEEHLAARKRRTSVAAQTIENRTNANSTRNLTHKSSLKDLTGRSKASSAGGRSAFGDEDDDEDLAESGASDDQLEPGLTHKQDTIRSNFSRTNERRRSVFTEMTSAFIVPDITLHRTAANGTVRSVLEKLSPHHDTSHCSVCARIIGSALPEGSIPAPVPVSTRPEVQADVDATIRPTQGPLDALAKVMKELQDELVHLKLELHVTEGKLRAQDPALGKRARKGLHERLAVLNKSIETKSDQIYALYDVLEAHKAEIADGVVPEEIEKTMESLRGDREKGKKVAFGNADEEDEDSDVPWAGISDTESLHRG